MLLSDAAGKCASLPALSQASGVARSTRGLCPTQVGGQPRTTSPAAKPNNVIAQCADAEETLRFQITTRKEIRMRKLLAMIALAAPTASGAAASGTAGVRRGRSRRDVLQESRRVGHFRG